MRGVEFKTIAVEQSIAPSSSRLMLSSLSTPVYEISSSRMRSPNAAWHARPLPFGMKLRRVFRPLLFRAWRVVQRWQNRQPNLVRLARLTLHTLPEVFNPSQHFSSKILARYVATLRLRARQVLDLGTGTGVIGIVAARAGAHVLAADLNAHAVALTHTNAAANHVELQTRRSDLFESLGREEKFDWIIFNPPFYAKPALATLQSAYNAGPSHETFARFFQQAQSFLLPQGKVLLIVSSDMALAEIERLWRAADYELVQLETVPHWFEIFYLIQLTPS